MKALLVFFTLTFSILNNCISQSKDSVSTNYRKSHYKFDDSIIQEIEKGITKLDSLDGRTNESYFLLIGSLDNDILFIINSCSGCPLEKLLQSTNRFTLVKAGKLEIPLIFYYDLKYSNLLEDANGHRIIPNIGGYGFRVSKRGRIIERGLQ